MKQGTSKNSLEIEDEVSEFGAMHDDDERRLLTSILEWSLKEKKAIL